METSIRRFATSLGKSDHYHDTITVAFLTLIRQRIHERGDGGSSHEFLQKNSDLLDKSVLFRFYSRAQLESPLARCIFILPERPPAAVTE